MSSVTVDGLGPELWEYLDKIESFARLGLVAGLLIGGLVVVLVTALLLAAGLRR